MTDARTPAEIHRDDQHEAADLAHLAAGGWFAPLSTAEHAAMAQLLAARPRLCDHIAADRPPFTVHWSPRAPGEIQCADCAAATQREAPDTCDGCGWRAATGWSRSSIPATRVVDTRSTAHALPVIDVYLRLCDDCLSPLPEPERAS